MGPYILVANGTIASIGLTNIGNWDNKIPVVGGAMGPLLITARGFQLWVPIHSDSHAI